MEKLGKILLLMQVVVSIIASSIYHIHYGYDLVFSILLGIVTLPIIIGIIGFIYLYGSSAGYSEPRDNLPDDF